MGGNPVQEATLVLRLGGRHVTEQLMNQLLNGKYSFPDDNFMLWRKKKKTNFTVSSRKEIIREMKVNEKIRIEISKVAKLAFLGAILHSDNKLQCRLGRCWLS